MAAWLDRLRRLGARLTPPAVGEAHSTLLVSGLGWQAPEESRTSPAREARIPVVPATTAAAEPPPRFSAWERLAGDPGADALRAQWEARWDEF